MNFACPANNLLVLSHLKYSPLTSCLFTHADQRRDRLDESKKMWQFLWDMAEEEQWIKEMSQLMSSPDLGHDLPSVHRLLNKHRAHEEEMKTRREMLQVSH